LKELPFASLTFLGVKMSSNKTVNINKAEASKSIIGAGLSQAATSILVKNLNAQTVAGAQGTDPSKFDTDEVTLALVVFDESGSMDIERDSVVNEFREDLEAIKKSSQADEILLSEWAFNTASRMIHSYLTLDLVEGLDTYHPSGGTALYDALLDAYTSLVAYEKELKAQGYRTKINIAVFTDGKDNSSRATSNEVRVVTLELLKKENVTISLTGFKGSERDPRDQFDPNEIALELGIRTVIVAGASATERRRAFGTWSSSVIKTSQTKIGSQGGFFSP
jgi:hypothetical protein